MRAVIQRVSRGDVVIDGQSVGRIGNGLVILLGVKEGDTEEDARWLAEKCVHLRIFEDDQGKFNLNLQDVDGQILVVSQFTLYGDCRKGRRPSFTEAASPEMAESLYHVFIEQIRQKGSQVQSGVFGARMQVEIQNEGPVTLIVDSEDR